MIQRCRSWRRFGVLALVAALSPACGGGSKRVQPPLFQDSFAGSFPGTSWTAPAVTGAATAAIDPATGSRMPSLKITTTAAAATAKTTTTIAFNNPTVTFSLMVADVSSATTQLGTGTVTILDAPSPRSRSRPGTTRRGESRSTSTAPPMPRAASYPPTAVFTESCIA